MPKIEQKIIHLLSDYPEKEFYGQEIARKIACSKASASVVLKKMYDKKIVFKKTIGHMKLFQINQDNLEVKKFKIDLALNKLKPVIFELKKNSQKAILFGSASRGEQTSDSDLDLFIITKEKELARSVLKKYAKRLNIKAIIKTPGEWSEMETTNPEFYFEVKNGIILHKYVSRI